MALGEESLFVTIDWLPRFSFPQFSLLAEWNGNARSWSCAIRYPSARWTEVNGTLFAAMSISSPIKCCVCRVRVQHWIKLLCVCSNQSRTNRVKMVGFEDRHDCAYEVIKWQTFNDFSVPPISAKSIPSFLIRMWSIRKLHLPNDIVFSSPPPSSSIPTFDAASHTAIVVRRAYHRVAHLIWCIRGNHCYFRNVVRFPHTNASNTHKHRHCNALRWRTNKMRLKI